MLSRPRTPTTLVELAYLANRAEANLIKSPDYLPTVSVAMADALEEYLTKPSGQSYSSSVRNFTAAVAELRTAAKHVSGLLHPWAGSSRFVHSIQTRRILE